MVDRGLVGHRGLRHIWYGNRATNYGLLWSGSSPSMESIPILEYGQSTEGSSVLD